MLSFRSLFNYFPGLVILVFSMVALHSSIVVLEEYKILDQMYEARAPYIDNDSIGFLQSRHMMENIQKRGVQLYWSVLAVGFAGFLLLLLNARKLRQLKAAEEEKEKTLLLLENRLVAIESSSDGIAIIDRNENLTYMNRAFMRLHGIGQGDQQAYIGTAFRSLYSEENTELVQDDVMSSLNMEGVWKGEISLLGDGTFIDVEICLTKLASGGYIAAVRDISERKNDERRKEELQHQVYQAQKMEAIGRLAGGIAHDFNNILAAMNGYAEFLIDDLDEQSQQHSFAQNILAAGKQAALLVDQMLTFSRRKEGTFEIMNIQKPLQESLAMLSASLPKTIEVETEIVSGPVFIKGNSTQIAQIVMNLCVNAKDAMDDDRGTLTLSLTLVSADDFADPDILSDSLPPENTLPAAHIDALSSDTTHLILNKIARNQPYICLSVKDTGSGIERSTMEHMFDPFFTTKSLEKGTGLGLSTVHGIISSHQGAMVLESTVGKGTAFHLLFPVVDMEIEEQEVSQEFTEAAFEASILVVEDQESVRDMIMTLLQREGYEAEFAETGEQALAILRENPDYFDLVVTDQNMPKMTGAELAEAAAKAFPDLPFILMSGYSKQRLDDLKDECASIRSVLRKPLSRVELLNKIKTVLTEN